MLHTLILFLFLQTSDLYICTGSWSLTYHNNIKCKGLAKCTKEIIPTTLEEAQKAERKACKLCFKVK